MAKSFPSYQVNKNITSSPTKMRKCSSMDYTALENIKRTLFQNIKTPALELERLEDNIQVKPINVIVEIDSKNENVTKSETNESKNLSLSSTRSPMKSSKCDGIFDSTVVQVYKSKKQSSPEIDSIKSNELEDISLGRSNKTFVMDETLKATDEVDKSDNFKCDVINHELKFENTVDDNPRPYNPDSSQHSDIDFDKIEKIEELDAASLEKNNNYVEPEVRVEKPRFRPEKSFFNLLVDGKPSIMIITDDYIAYEPEFLLIMIRAHGKDKRKPDKQQAYDETKRVTIKLSNIIAAWTCNCEPSLSKQKSKKSQFKKNGDFSKSICSCIKERIEKSKTLNSETEPKLIDASDIKPLVVKVFFVEETKENCFRLNYIILDIDEEAMDENDRFKRAIGKRVPKNRDFHQRKAEQTGELTHKLKTKLESQFLRPKRLLLFVNPNGGSKKALSVFEQKARPIFELSRIELTSIVTERANHAKEFLIDVKNDLDPYDGIISIGGDGMFSEILNGLLIRTQELNNINYNSIDAKLVKPSFKLGIIPAGSTDTIVYSTNGSKDPIDSIVSIVFGKTLNMDVGAVHQREEETLIRYTASFMGYGFFGDTLLESERMRWMGPKRYDFAGIRKFFSHNVYSGEIKLCLEPSDGSPKDFSPCGKNCLNCSIATSKLEGLVNNDDAPACISIRGRFLAINSAILSCRCAKSKQGMSPMAHVGNGCADLILVSKCTRFQFLKYLLYLMTNTKKTFDFDFIDSYRVREFEFNPIIAPHQRKGYMFEKSTDCDFFDAFGNEKISPVSSGERSSSSNVNEDESSSSLHQNESKNKNLKKIVKSLSALSPSVWNCDGEIIPETAIHCKIHCQLISIYATGVDVGPELEGQWN